MKTLFYIPAKLDDLSRIYRLILILDRRIFFEIFRTLDSLEERISKQKKIFSSTVLYITDKEDLHDLVDRGDMFSNTKLILILPDHDNDTISIAQTLSPCFLTFVDNDFTDIRVVLSSMANELFNVSAHKKGGKQLYSPPDLHVIPSCY
jgi:hypothetical protein